MSVDTIQHVVIFVELHLYVTCYMFSSKWRVNSVIYPQSSSLLTKV